jgi:hypothetical protein
LKKFPLGNLFQNFSSAKPSAMPIPALPEFKELESEAGIREAGGFAEQKLLKNS